MIQFEYLVWFHRASPCLACAELWWQSQLFAESTLSLLTMTRGLCLHRWGLSIQFGTTHHQTNSPSCSPTWASLLHRLSVTSLFSFIYRRKTQACVTYQWAPETYMSYQVEFSFLLSRRQMSLKCYLSIRDYIDWKSILLCSCSLCCLHTCEGNTYRILAHVVPSQRTTCRLDYMPCYCLLHCNLKDTNTSYIWHSVFKAPMELHPARIVADSMILLDSLVDGLSTRSGQWLEARLETRDQSDFPHIRTDLTSLDLSMIVCRACFD